MIGIYRIRNPKGKVYIGQSVDIEKRFKVYKRLSCKAQTILYRSFIKYGVENHKFEIITECLESELNELERYYQDLYSAIGLKGLNCKLTKTDSLKGRHSEETKRKLSEATSKNRIGYKHSEETKLKIGLAHKGHKRGVGSKMPDHLRKTLIQKNIERSKIVLCLETGIFYDSPKYASKAYLMPQSTLTQRLNGTLKNKTSLIYV